MAKQVPIMKLHKGTGQAYVYYKGKISYMGKFGTDAADKKYWIWRGTLGKDLSYCSVEELLTRYETMNKKTMPSRARHQLKRLRECLFTIGKLDTQQFGPLAYQAMRDNVIKQSRRTAHTINQMMQLLQRIFRWGVSMQLVDVQIWNALKTVKPLRDCEVEKQPVGRKPVAKEVVDATVPYLHSFIADIIHLMRYTAARPGEIVGIRKSCIDRNGPHGVWVYRPDQHKTSYRQKKRNIVFNKSAQLILSRLLTGSPSDTDWLFPSQESDSGHYTPAALSKAVRVVCKARAIPRWTPYQIRHTRLTELATDQGLEAAAIIAGHGSTEVTQGYAHQPDARAIQNAQRMSQPSPMITMALGGMVGA